MCLSVPHLCVDYGSHPEPLGGSGHRQHGPQEHHDGEDQGDDRGADPVVHHDDEVADQLRVGSQQVVEGEEQLQQAGLSVVEVPALLQLLDEELPAHRGGNQGVGIHS